MFFYDQVYQTSLRHEPYDSPEEELMEYLWLVDAFLDTYFVLSDEEEGYPYECQGVPLVHERLPWRVDLLNGGTIDEPASFRLLLAELEKVHVHILSRRITTLEAEVTYPIDQLMIQFDLTDFELFCILLAYLPCRDRSYERIFAYIQNDRQAVYPTFGTAKALYSVWAEVGMNELQSMDRENDRLNRYLLRRDDDCVDVLRRRIVLKPRIVNILSGLDEVNRAELLYHKEESIAVRSIQQPLLDRLHTYDGKTGVVVLYGREEKSHLLCRLAGQMHRDLLMVPVSRMYKQGRLQKEKLYELFFEMIWGGALLAFQMEESQSPQELLKLCATAPGIVYVTSDERIPRMAGVALKTQIEVPFLSAGERQLVWHTLADGTRLAPDVDLTDIANKYILSETEIGRICEEIRTREEHGLAADKVFLVRTIQNHSRIVGNKLLKKIPAMFTWDDIVLNDEQKKVLQLVCNRVRLSEKVGEEWGYHRIQPYGRSLSLLMYGAPGTGKTMAAQVIANETGMELYRVDLGQLMDKYVGETEKNLSSVFDETESSNVILFFDEADSLFSRRTDVSQASDKYSNSETSYILQRIEDYSGVVILATNLIQNFDPAFMRRITYSVKFEKQDPQTSLKIWKNCIPKELPIDPMIDFGVFAENLDLSGSSIKAVMISAAYMAADENCRVEARHIVQALKYEYQKQGRLISSVDLGSYKAYL